MSLLPYDISRCPARHGCPDKADCLRHTAPGLPDGFQPRLEGRRVQSCQLPGDDIPVIAPHHFQPTARQREPKSDIPRSPAVGFHLLGLLIGEDQ